jgi:ABC-type branched-subunit amino acid transport system permease subunit
LVGGVFTFWLPIVSSQFVASQPWIPTGIAAAFKNAGPQVTYGALLIVIMIFAPNGIVGLVTTGYARLQARLRGAGDRGSGQMPSDPQTV